MKVSTKGRYALKFMFDLALNADIAPISLRDVSARQDVSVKYLEQIVPPLVNAGFILSTRGKSGGYSLSKNASEYTVGDIVNLLEGDVAPAPCTANAPCPNAAGCVEKKVWDKVKAAVDGVLNSITLQDMVDESHGGSKGEL